MRIVKTILGIKEKKRVGGITLPYFKTNYKATIQNGGRGTDQFKKKPKNRKSRNISTQIWSTDFL